MKRLRLVALLTATLGLVANLGRQTPIYAASEPAPSVGSEQDGHTTNDGAQSYATHCAVCHGEHMEGILPSFPPLQGIGRQLKDQQIIDLIHSGKGRMPGFPKLQSDELAALMHYLTSEDIGVTTSNSTLSRSSARDAGKALFQRHCAFCHGRDAAGGETGPDLTRSKLVIGDDDGDRISEVVRNGRLDKKMPSFNFSNDEMISVVSFVKAQEAKAASQKGGRRGVDVSDLQTGSVEAGKQYFNGAGGCAACHSPTGDLAGVASRYQGLQLEERMLYPRGARSRATVTLPSGEKITGTVAYLDEFVIGLREKDGTYRSWSAANVKYTLDSPVQAHVEQFGKYSDADIHNLMAYLQTLR